eukprot:COSAG06_NODE_360_length_16832_cov_9.250209_4_plen_369_part_00
MSVSLSLSFSLFRTGPEGTTRGPKSGRCLRLVPHNPPLTPNDCADLCEGGSLASIADASEQAEIDALMLDPPAEIWTGEPPQYAWIGAYNTKPMEYLPGASPNFPADQWAWADGAIPLDGRDNSKCTSMANDCCAPGTEEQSCSDGFVAVPLDDSQSQFPNLCMGGWYTCCPPDEAACGKEFANWAPANMPACVEERCAWNVPQPLPTTGQPQAGWYSWPCAVPLDSEWAPAVGACVCIDAAPTAAYLNTTELHVRAEPNCENCRRSTRALADNTCEPMTAPGQSPVDQYPGAVGAVCAILTLIVIGTFFIYPCLTNAYDRRPGAEALVEEGGVPARAKNRKRVDTDALTGLRGVAAMHVALGHHFQV